MAEKQGVDTQETTFLNIPVEVATQIGTDEPHAEIILDFIEELFVVTLEPSQGTELIEMEPHHQDDDEVEQGADTQEPASPNILVEVATQIGVDEPKVENIPNFNEEFYAVTPEPSQDT